MSDTAGLNVLASAGALNGPIPDEPYETVTLKDGRKLAYLAVGPARGIPLFHFHGHGSSRLEALTLEDAASRAGVRVFAFDRPGIGRSDMRTGDRLLDWPSDIVEAADLVGVERFAVQGMSAGGPYALACAHALSNRVTACSLVSALPPPQIARWSGPFVRRFFWWVAWRFPDYLRKRLEQFRPDGVPNEAMVRARIMRIGQWLGGEDLRLMRDDGLLNLLARTMMETGRQGAAANRDEIERLVKPWGFDFRKVSVPVRLWHGLEDRILHPGPARALARRLKNCRSVFLEREGHFSVLVNHANDLMAAVAPS